MNTRPKARLGLADTRWCSRSSADLRRGRTRPRLISWTKSLLLSGELARSQPKRLRHRLFHTAARLAFSGRRAKLRLQRSWPWAGELAAAFARLEALTQPVG